MSSQREDFLRSFNEAFARADNAYIVEQMTDDVQWTMLGDRTVKGKEEVKAYLETMPAPYDIEIMIHHIITHGKHASVNGEFKMKWQEGDEWKAYGFCDVYVLSGFKNGKVKELTSYVVQVKEED